MSKKYLSREELENLEKGNIIRYNSKIGICYLVVEGVRGERVSGQIASPYGVNSVSIDELVKMNPRLGKFD